MRVVSTFTFGMLFTPIDVLKRMGRDESTPGGMRKSQVTHPSAVFTSDRHPIRAELTVALLPSLAGSRASSRPFSSLRITSLDEIGTRGHFRTPISISASRIP
jgi:hypothetical protein